LLGDFVGRTTFLNAASKALSVSSAPTLRAAVTNLSLWLGSGFFALFRLVFGFGFFGITPAR
jgi:hypothetical protein